MSKAIGFIMLPVYAFFLRGEGYGIIGMIDVILTVLTLLIGYGISGTLRRFYFQKPTELDQNIFVSTNIVLMFFLVIAVTIPALFFREQIAQLAFGKNGMGFYVTLALCSFIADVTGRNAESYIIILQKSILYTELAIARLVIGLSLNIYLIVHLRLAVLGFLYSGLITAIIFSFVMHGYVLYHVGLHFRNSDAKDILEFSLPLLPGYVAMFFRNNTDRIMLRKYLGLAQLGAFEMLFKFATLIGVLISEPFMKSWDVKRFEICEKPDGPAIMARVFTLQLAVNLFIGLILSLEIPLLLKVLTPKEFWLGGDIALLAVASRIILDSYYQFFFGLLYAKRTFLISIIQFISAGLSVIINWIFIKKYGVLGAVTASCVVNAAQSLIAYYLAQKYYRIPFEWVKVTCMVFTVFILFILINLISIEGTVLGNWMSNSMREPFAYMMHALHLNAFKGGKLMNFVINNIPTVIEGGGKLILSFLFILILPLFGIYPRDLLRKMRDGNEQIETV